MTAGTAWPRPAQEYPVPSSPPIVAEASSVSDAANCGAPLNVRDEARRTSEQALRNLRESPGVRDACSEPVPFLSRRAD